MAESMKPIGSGRSLAKRYEKSMDKITGRLKWQWLYWPSMNPKGRVPQAKPMGI